VCVREAMILKLPATAPPGCKVRYVSTVRLYIHSTSGGGMENHLELLSVIMCNYYGKGSQELAAHGRCKEAVELLNKVRGNYWGNTAGSECKVSPTLPGQSS
jgi:hypothetical protein